ncbi:Hpt domain-containing protein [Patescibacteria group bacterium]
MEGDIPIEEFLDEVVEIIDVIKSSLRLLESNLNQKKEAPELLTKLHRCFHSIKGISGLFGFAEISQLSHVLEVLCNNLRIKALSLNLFTLRMIEEATLAMEKSLPSSGIQEIQPIEALDDLMQRITKVNDTCGSTEDVSGLVLTAKFIFSREVTRSLQEFEEARLIACFKQNKKIYLIHLMIDISEFDKIKELQSCLAQFGEVIALLTGEETTDKSKMSFKILFATDLDFELFAPMVQIQDTKADNSDVFEDNDIPEVPG